jgi:hypothetical protein
MHSRTTIGIALAIFISAIATATTGLRVGGNQNPKQTGGLQIPVVSKQLPAENGVTPVELQCENAELSAPNSLEKLVCIIRNNTNKSISAGAIYTSFTLEKSGEVFVSSSYGTFDTFLHPDFREEHQNNLILPRGESRHEDLPVSYDHGIVIKAVTMGIDYIEFADHTSLGTNQAGSRIIADTREGAVKYKNWLAQKYEQSGGSLDAIVPLLEQNQSLPQELAFQTAPEEHGARMYRNFALRTYKTKGAEGLVKHLKHTKTSGN